MVSDFKSTYRHYRIPCTYNEPNTQCHIPEDLNKIKHDIKYSENLLLNNVLTNNDDSV